MVAAAAVLWGLSGTAAKLLLNRDVDTVLLVQMRATFAAAAMALLLAAARPSALRVPLRDLWRFALLGIAGIAGANFTYYFAIKEGTVATAILLQYTAPVLVMGYAAWTREERVTPTKVIAAAIAIAGCTCAVGGYDAAAGGMTRIGLASGILSAFCFGFLTVYTRHLLERTNVWTVTLYALLSASAFWLIVNPPSRIAAQSPSPGTWLLLGGLALTSVLIPHTLYFNGLRHVVASRAIIVSTLEPVVAIVSAALVIGEGLTPLQVSGAGLVLLAITVLQLRREPGGENLQGGNHATQ